MIKCVCVLTSVVVCLLVSLSSSVSALHLIPATPEKEVFTGESFVITCLDDKSDKNGKVTGQICKWVNCGGDL